jgi:glyoxylase-like metal-dependent hydrolase (beta-lactamase superfamily II)
MLELGRYRLASLLESTFALDGGALFGSTPRAVWERWLPADERNRVRLSARCLLAIDTSSPRRILVGSGLGRKWSAEDLDLLSLDPCLGIEPALARHGLERTAITDVVLTHLHFDHAGGITRVGPGRVELTFPGAVYHLQRRHWQWAHSPTEKDADGFRRQDFEPLQHTDRLHLLDGEGELFPDFEVLISEGHTPGQQLPRIHGQATHLTHCGDLIPTRAHLAAGWISGLDLEPLTTIDEKKMLLAQTLEEDGILFFEHDPQVAACRLGERDGQPIFRDTVEL